MPTARSGDQQRSKAKPDRKGRREADPTGLTEEELDRIVAEVTRGVVVSGGKTITYYKVGDRSAGSNAPSLRGLADVALPDDEQRERERKRTQRLLARARAEEQRLGQAAKS